MLQSLHVDVLYAGVCLRSPSLSLCFCVLETNVAAGAHGRWLSGCFLLRDCAFSLPSRLGCLDVVNIFKLFP